MKKGKAVTEKHQRYNEKAKEFALQYGEKIIMMPEDSL